MCAGGTLCLEGTTAKATPCTQLGRADGVSLHPGLIYSTAELTKPKANSPLERLVTYKIINSFIV
jgi:hypothetical protein